MLPIRDVLSIKISPIAPNNKLKSIYNENDTLVKVEFEYRNFKPKMHFVLSRYSNIMTNSDYSTTELKNDSFMKVVNEYKPKAPAKLQLDMISKPHSIRWSNFRTK